MVARLARALPMHLRTTILDTTNPKIIGILNVTPDSFATVGRELDPARALAHAQLMVRSGAAMIDVGAESTKPGSSAVSPAEQLSRLLPVVSALRSDPLTQHTPLSIDTTSSHVARACLELGAECINDVSGGTADKHMRRVVSQFECGYIIMHRAVKPAEDHYSDAMPRALLAGNAVQVVIQALRDLRDAAVAAGIDPQRIALDPGLGFGKTVEQNLALIDATPQILTLGHPVVSALSRKSFVGRIGLGRDSTPDERLPATLELSKRHIDCGATLLRVHDVPEHAQMLVSREG